MAFTSCTVTRVTTVDGSSRLWLCDAHRGVWWVWTRNVAVFVLFVYVREKGMTVGDNSGPQPPCVRVERATRQRWHHKRVMTERRCCGQSPGGFDFEQRLDMTFKGCTEATGAGDATAKTWAGLGER